MAIELECLGVEVLAVDHDEALVQSLSANLAHVVRADITSEAALQQLGIPEFDRVVIAVGHNLETSIMAVALCVDSQIPGIWAKAISREHGRILQKLGVHHVVYPEVDTGRRVAHLLNGSMLDYTPYEDGFVMFTAKATKPLTGRPLNEADFRHRYGLNVVAYKRDGDPWKHTIGDTVLDDGDTVLVFGPQENAERFDTLK